MQIVVVTPESTEPVVHLARYLAHGQDELQPLARLERNERIRHLMSLVNNTKQGEQFLLAALDHTRVVGLLGSEHRVWDSDFFEVPVSHIESFVIEHTRSRRDLVEKELIGCFLESIRAGQRYIVAQLSPSDSAHRRALESAGFRFLVPMVTMGRKSTTEAGSWNVLPSCSIRFDSWIEKDLDEIVKMARSAFVHSRFHVEPRLSLDVANELHARWAYNCCRGGLADAVLVARFDGRVAGFIAIKVKQVDSVRLGKIVLLATDPTIRRKGVGIGLIRAAVDWFGETTDYLCVTTEMTNLSAIRAYSRAGYRTEVMTAYFTRWIE